MWALTLIVGCSAVIAASSTKDPRHVVLSPLGEIIRTRSKSNSELFDLDASAVPKEREFIKQDGDGNDWKKRTLQQRVTGSTPTGRIQVGSPLKDMNVIFDTGSDRFIAKTWDTISHMISGVDDGIHDLIMPTNLLYDHGTSSTYKQVLIKNGNKSEPAFGQISYGSGDAVTEEGTDTVKVGKRTLVDFPVDEIRKDSLAMLHTSEGISGVFGLMHMKNLSAGESAFSRLWKAGEMTAFGFCYGAEDQSIMLWGDTSNEGEEIPVIGESHWAVDMSSFAITEGTNKPQHEDHKNDVPMMPILAQQGHWPVLSEYGEPIFSDYGDGSYVDDKIWSDEQNPTISVDPKTDRQIEDDGGSDDSGEVSACKDKPCAAIIDTGSNILAGPTKFLKSLVKKLGVKYDCSNLDELDDISFNLGKVLIKISPQSYVMKVKLPSYWQGGVHDIQGAGETPGAGGSGGEGDANGGSIGGESAGGEEDTAASMKAMEDAVSHWLSHREDKHHDHSRAGSAAEFSDEEVYAPRHRDPFRPFLSDIASLSQEAHSRRLRTGVRTGWPAALHQLAAKTGIDLRIALPDDVPELISNGTIGDLDSMCMPAFSPMDMVTKFGPLFVVGTPLFDQHYVRFSRESPNQVEQKDKANVVAEHKDKLRLIEDAKDPDPKIFMMDMAKCTACKGLSLNEKDNKNKDGTKEHSDDTKPADDATPVEAKLSTDANFLEATKRRQLRSKNSPVEQPTVVQGKPRPIISPREMRIDEIRLMHPSKVGWEL